MDVSVLITHYIFDNAHLWMQEYVYFRIDTMYLHVSTCNYYILSSPFIQDN